MAGRRRHRATARSPRQWCPRPPSRDERDRQCEHRSGGAPPAIPTSLLGRVRSCAARRRLRSAHRRSSHTWSLAATAKHKQCCVLTAAYAQCARWPYAACGWCDMARPVSLRKQVTEPTGRGIRCSSPALTNAHGSPFRASDPLLWAPPSAAGSPVRRAQG
jgi:hypothetical protein